MRPVAVLFAKAPLPGGVKTRLMPPLTAADCAALHRAFVRDTLELLLRFRANMDIELSLDREAPDWAVYPVARSVQTAGSLGDRIGNALRAALAGGRPLALIFGSDSPTLPAGHIEALLGSGADVTFGPAEDGGFYAVACRRWGERMFHCVQWSHPDTLNQAVAACRASGLSVALGPSWYDVDDAAGLRRLAREPLVPIHTAAAICGLPGSGYL